MDGPVLRAATNESAIFSNSSAPYSSTSPQSRSLYDHDGAMRFTVAVVMVYGIGVILMLGFHVQKKRSSQKTEEEGYEYVKRWSRRGHREEKKERKIMFQFLIQGIHDNLNSVRGNALSVDTTNSLQNTSSHLVKGDTEVNMDSATV